ncbi:hypothetical protein BGZ95_005607, partial [Linnemannia exigua]
MHNGLPIKLRISRNSTGMTLCIVGMGGTGKAVAKRAQSLRMTIIYHNRHRIPNQIVKQHPYLKAARYTTSLDELLEISKVVSIHVPLLPETTCLIYKEHFQRMKTGSYLVNTSRRPVVDEQALANVLKLGQTGGAGLEVFENEPKVHPGLLNDMNVTLMPHLGAFTIETLTRMETLAM